MCDEIKYLYGNYNGPFWPDRCFGGCNLFINQPDAEKTFNCKPYSSYVKKMLNYIQPKDDFHMFVVDGDIPIAVQKVPDLRFEICFDARHEPKRRSGDVVIYVKLSGRKLFHFFCRSFEVGQFEAANLSMD